MLYILIWVIMGALVSAVANSKGRNAALWFIYGATIWPVALIHVSFLKTSTEAKQQIDESPHRTAPIMQPVEPLSDLEKTTLKVAAIVIGGLCFGAGLYYAYG